MTSLRELIEEGAAELEAALKRMSSIELEHQELQSQLDKATMQGSKDADEIADLKAELGHAQESIAALTDVAARREIMLNTLERTASESLERANLAMSKLNALEDYVERWLGEDIRKKQDAEAAVRKKREEKEMRKRAQEAARLERERTEKEEQRTRAEWEMSMLDRWGQYQEPDCQGELTFENIVWPVLIPPADLSGITEDAIECFLFSEIHSMNRKRHQRLNDAIKRWNPTRYAALEARVKPCDRNIVEQAFHAITMHLGALRDMRAQSADV
ncbi:hypothetical protein PENSPDRAFT_682954 [Peniophora sp. CONT]|nr:hypothetical protein PENSPDRAFT_682954 [Peniophora sp. CONT]